MEEFLNLKTLFWPICAPPLSYLTVHDGTQRSEESVHGRAPRQLEEVLGRLGQQVRVRRHQHLRNDGGRADLPSGNGKRSILGHAAVAAILFDSLISVRGSNNEE